MIDFAEAERLNYREDAAITRLDSILGEVAGFAETRTAFELASILKKKVAAEPALGERIGTFIAKFSALGLPLFSDEESISVFDHVQAILADERISLYERLRARLLVLPQSMRGAFASKALAKIHASSEPFGGNSADPSVPSTVGAWVTAFDASGSNPETFFKTPYVAGLPEDANHAVRHLIHTIGLLASPGSIDSRPIALPKRPEPPKIPPVPANLPVEPMPSKARIPAPPVMMKEPIPVSPPVMQPIIPPRPPIPAAAPTVISPVKGPSAAAVIARLQQAQFPGPPTPATVAHLTPDDHEEIKGHTERLASYDAGPNVHDSVGATVEAIIAEHHLAFQDDNLRRRFVTIMTSRIKEIRNATDTLDLLTRETKVGGMGYDPDLAEKLVMRATDESAKFLTEEGVKKLSEQQRVVVPVMPRPPKVPIEPAPAPAPVPVLSPAPAPSTPPQAASSVPIAVFPAPFRIPVQKIPAASTPQQGYAPQMPTASIRPMQTERPTIADIRGTPRLVGPIEELRLMTIVDFRHLGDGPVACIRRVYEKIQLIGKESYTKRSEGIKAWRASETYQLYLSMGRESLISGKAIRDVIAEHQRLGQPSLTDQEFSLVADLNRKLRY